VDNILVERDVLTSTKSPWLVKLLYAFQDQNNVFLAMEFVPGGDMRALLGNVGSLEEEPAKFYMAEMILSMVSLHSLGYIHRDLKPENYLIDERGHIKLTDFGLAKGNLSAEWLEEIKRKVLSPSPSPSPSPYLFLSFYPWHFLSQFKITLTFLSYFSRTFLLLPKAEEIHQDLPIYRSSVERKKIFQKHRREQRPRVNFPLFFSFPPAKFLFRTNELKLNNQTKGKKLCGNSWLYGTRDDGRPRIRYTCRLLGNGLHYVRTSLWFSFSPPPLSLYSVSLFLKSLPTARLYPLCSRNARRNLHQY